MTKIPQAGRRGNLLKRYAVRGSNLRRSVPGTRPAPPASARKNQEDEGQDSTGDRTHKHPPENVRRRRTTMRMHMHKDALIKSAKIRGSEGCAGKE